MTKIAIATIMLIGVLGSSSASRADDGPMSNHKDWGNWSFDWAVDNSSGITISNVKFNGTYYIYRANMPSIRVQYDQTCGPFLDRIRWTKMCPTNETALCPASEAALPKVRLTEMPNGSLKVWARAFLGSYNLVNAWYFYSDGRLLPTLESSGLQCMVNHRHHPYWRIDADVGGSGNDQILTYTSGVWTTWTQEFNQNKASGRAWVIQDLTANKFIWVSSGANDNNPDSFSTIDLAGRAYRYPWEHDPWAPNTGDYSDTEGELVLQSKNSESIDHTDVVFWYVGHLSHLASGGATQVIFSGPTLTLY